MRMSLHLWRTRLLLIGVLLAAGGAALWASTQSKGQAPSSRIETVATGPAGQTGPINIIVPNYPPHPGMPVVKGPYRLIPYGYSAGPSTILPTPFVCDRPTGNPGDLGVVKSASFYADAVYVPAGFSYAPPTATEVCGATVVEIQWVFPGQKASTVQVTRGPRDLPLDINVPVDDSWLVLVEGTVRGTPAIFHERKPGQFGPQAIYLVKDGITTVIIGDIADFGELIKVAESLP